MIPVQFDNGYTLQALRVRRDGGRLLVAYHDADGELVVQSWLLDQVVAIDGRPVRQAVTR